MVLASKGGIMPPLPYDQSAGYLQSALDASLRRMKVDTIDLYQIHRPDILAHPQEVARVLDDAVAAIKHVAKRFVITLGADGALCWDGETLHRVAAQPVEAVNTNGAGDMFAGAFLYALSRGETDLRATEFATLAAGEVVKYFGPRLDRDACLGLRRQFFGD